VALLKPLPQARFGYKVLLVPLRHGRVGNYVQGPMGVNHREPRPLVAVGETISVIEIVARHLLAILARSELFKRAATSANKRRDPFGLPSIQREKLQDQVVLLAFRSKELGKNSSLRVFSRPLYSLILSDCVETLSKFRDGRALA
jgi:hypothetical protein